MKEEVLRELDEFETRLRRLRKDVGAVDGERVGRLDLRRRAEQLADYWVENLRSPLEHKFLLDPETIAAMSNDMKRLHVLSRPGNRKSSYESTLKSVLANFKNRFVLPIQ